MFAMMPSRVCCELLHGPSANIDTSPIAFGRGFPWVYPSGFALFFQPEMKLAKLLLQVPSAFRTRPMAH
jgi:hypothetical protein